MLHCESERTGQRTYVLIGSTDPTVEAARICHSSRGIPRIPLEDPAMDRFRERMSTLFTGRREAQASYVGSTIDALTRGSTQNHWKHRTGNKERPKTLFHQNPPPARAQRSEGSSTDTTPTPDAEGFIESDGKPTVFVCNGLGTDAGVRTVESGCMPRILSTYTCLCQVRTLTAWVRLAMGLLESESTENIAE
ncbi:hypothetical protein ASPSYDRAFT_541814 [Aspergillus sydowii CBS 593.65]|uniref:Uncharacterized protein n=1 Tax=Aspergillus sydowii CBS 593.65 TaxID=1036612 RepID=A0A1L9T0U9_9EURO|nr:uncharacterized protein ASPSYDRAFT_541814 [Aspergillus sydowii CBS 593.65]OJJ53092.1 hypothetical protein ASPSYDRAFT_541814 [Aspergillus sydowii CBS 593.65]